jgi:hypothetical protein
MHPMNGHKVAGGRSCCGRHVSKALAIRRQCQLYQPPAPPSHLQADADTSRSTGRAGAAGRSLHTAVAVIAAATQATAAYIIQWRGAERGRHALRPFGL